MKRFFSIIIVTALILSVAPGWVQALTDDGGFIHRSFAAPAPNVTGAAFDGKFLWVADWKEDVIYKIDPKSGKLLGSIASPGPRPTGLAWDGSHLWVADIHWNKAYRINPEKKSVVWEIHLPGICPLGMAWDGKYLWYSDKKKKKIYKISPTDGAVFHDIEKPGGEITGITFFKGYLWAANRLDDEIYMIDPENGDVINIYKSPGAHPWGLTHDGKHLIHVDYQEGKVFFLKTVPKGKPWVRSDKKDYILEFTLDFYNYGKDPVNGGEMLVALPVDRENQDIAKKVVFSPSPGSIIKTSIDQKYARWALKNLKAPARKRVEAGWEMSLYAVDWFVFPEKVKGAGSIPANIKKLYLANGEKYLLNDPFIKETVKEVVGDEKNLYHRARKLYNWVIEKLSYKYEGGWETGPKVLKRGSGSCSEYTFAFISLCRAAGVPARFVGSIVVRRDDASTDDIFHRWAEIYLPPYGWIPIDANHGDKPDGRGKALGFGHLTNNLLVTTVEGGAGDNKLGWSYNYGSSHTYKGQANTCLEGIAFWRPLGKNN